MEEIMDCTDMRNLDVTTSSMNPVELNNLVVSMRSVTKKCKVYIARKLMEQIKKLRNKTGSEKQSDTIQTKIERLLRELEALKNLHPDRITKHALANVTPLSDLGKLNDPESQVLLRMACHKVLSERIQVWRDKHEDWKSLAAFLLYKNTGRKFKKKKKPNAKKLKKPQNKPSSMNINGAKNTNMINEVNILRDETDHKPKQKALQTVHEKYDDTNKIERTQDDCKKIICVVDEDELKNGHEFMEKQSTVLEKIEEEKESSVSSDEDAKEDQSDDMDSACTDTNCENDGIKSPSKLEPDKGKKHTERPAKLNKSLDAESVVKKFNLNVLDDNTDDISFIFKKEQNEDVLPSDQSGLKNDPLPKKRDPFFCASGSSGDEEDSERDGSGSDPPSDGDDEFEDIYSSKRIPQESTFLPTLGYRHKQRINGNRSQIRDENRGRGGRNFRAGKPAWQERKEFDGRRGTYNERKGFQQNRSRIKEGRGRFEQNKGRFQDKDYKDKGRLNKWDSTSKEEEQPTEKKRPASESLHPSWIARKKQREQLSQIGAFQGKKITFDD